jgi:hypothetical protein
MHFRCLALILISALVATQMPAQTQNMPSTPSAPAGIVTVASGTIIPLTLVSSIRSKATKPGDSVRAMVAFPVTVGTQIAIPAGTYVEGEVTSIKNSHGRAQPATVKLHFTRLLFANGYSAPLDASNVEALLLDSPVFAVQPVGELADARDGAPFLGESMSAAAQTPPTLPPLPHIGPNQGVIIGAVAGSAALTLVLALVMSRRHMASTDFVLFESGWQFQMALNQPLQLDASQVAAAAATAPQR